MLGDVHAAGNPSRVPKAQMGSSAFVVRVAGSWNSNPRRPTEGSCELCGSLLRRCSAGPGAPLASRPPGAPRQPSFLHRLLVQLLPLPLSAGLPSMRFPRPDRSRFFTLHLFLFYVFRPQTAMTSYGKKGLPGTHPGGTQKAARSREVTGAPWGARAALPPGDVSPNGQVPERPVGGCFF